MKTSSVIERVWLVGVVAVELLSWTGVVVSAGTVDIAGIGTLVVSSVVGIASDDETMTDAVVDRSVVLGKSVCA